MTADEAACSVAGCVYREGHDVAIFPHRVEGGKDASVAVRLSLAPGAPEGALPSCPGQLEVDLDRNNCGSWSTSCTLDVSVRCEAGMCWWSRLVTGPITPDLMRAAEFLHWSDAWNPPPQKGDDQQV